MVLKRIRKNLYFFLPIILLFTFFYFISRSVPEESIKQILEQAGFLGPMVFIFLVFITAIIAPISSTPFVFAGFYVFGPEIVLYFTLANIFSSITNFWIARIFGQSFVKKLIGQANTQKMDQLTKNYGLLTLFFLRIFQGGIHDFISYAAGLTSIRFTPYFFISLLGMIPGMALWYFIAIKTQNPLIFTAMTLILLWAFSLSFIVILSIKKIIPKK